MGGGGCTFRTLVSNIHGHFVFAFPFNTLIAGSPVVSIRSFILLALAESNHDKRADKIDTKHFLGSSGAAAGWTGRFGFPGLST